RVGVTGSETTKSQEGRNAPCPFDDARLQFVLAPGLVSADRNLRVVDLPVASIPKGPIALQQRGYDSRVWSGIVGIDRTRAAAKPRPAYWIGWRGDDALV